MKRYEPSLYDNEAFGTDAEMEEAEDGDWVRYEDAQKLAADNERLRDALRPLATWHQNASENCDCHFCRAKKVLEGK